MRISIALVERDLPGGRGWGIQNIYTLNHGGMSGYVRAARVG